MSNQWQIERRRKTPYTEQNPWRWCASAPTLEKALPIARRAQDRVTYDARAHAAVSYVVRIVHRSSMTDRSDRYAAERYRLRQPLNQ